MNKRFGGDTLVAARWFAIIASALLGACGDASGPGSRTVAALKIATGDKQVASAGSALASPVTFTAVDDEGRAVSGVIVAFTVSAGGGSVAAGRDTSDGSGNVTAQWTVGTTAGQAQQLTATVVSSSSIAPVQATASVVAGPGSALSGAVSSVAARAGDPLGAIAVTVRDKYGNAASSSNVRVTVRLENTTATTLAGTLESRTDGSGGAVFTNLSTTGKSGALTLLFESDGLSPARVSLALSGGQPAKVATVTNATIDAEALLSGPPVSAKVLDTWDNPVAGVNVSFSIDGSSIGSATSGPDGVATLTAWTVPQIGSYKLVASAAGVATGAQFTVNARTVAAKTLVPLASNPTSGSVGQSLVLAVTALDAIGRPVPGAALTWTLADLDRQVTTDGNGVATFTANLPTKAGTNQIVVRASQTVSTTISIQGLPGALVSVVPDKDSIDARAGSTVSATFVAQDAYGNPVPNIALSGLIFAPFGAAQIIPVVSDAQGVITVTTTLDQYAGFVDLGATFGTKVTRVFASADVGSVRIVSPVPCTKSVNAGTTVVVDGRVFGTNGRPIAGVPVVWTSAVGSGPISAISPNNPQSTVTVTSGAFGSSSVVWFVPQQIGIYSLTAQGPTGYDAPPSVTLTCSVN